MYFKTYIISCLYLNKLYFRNNWTNFLPYKTSLYGHFFKTVRQSVLYYKRVIYCSCTSYENMRGERNYWTDHERIIDVRVEQVTRIRRPVHVERASAAAIEVKRRHRPPIITSNNTTICICITCTLTH